MVNIGQQLPTLQVTHIVIDKLTTFVNAHKATNTNEDDKNK